MTSHRICAASSSPFHPRAPRDGRSQFSCGKPTIQMQVICTRGSLATYKKFLLGTGVHNNSSPFSESGRRILSLPAGQARRSGATRPRELRDLQVDAATARWPFTNSVAPISTSPQDRQQRPHDPGTPCRIPGRPSSPASTPASTWPRAPKTRLETAAPRRTSPSCRGA